MKISFLTLGCPQWDLDTICRRGREYGFDGVDFRGYLDTLDISQLPEFTTHAMETLRQLNSAGLEVSGISSSITICQPEKRAANLEEARRTIDLACGLGTVNVRIFGGGDLEHFTRQELAQIGGNCLGEILALEGADQLHWLFETHDLWVSARDCRLLLENNPNPAFGALWDMGHTSRVGGETPAETYAALEGRIGYTHIKDAVYEPAHPQAMQDGWHYVAPGSGQLPLVESLRVLKRSGYAGWLAFEHEKRWHPSLQEPEDIFPGFVGWIRSLGM